MILTEAQITGMLQSALPDSGAPADGYAEIDVTESTR